MSNRVIKSRILALRRGGYTNGEVAQTLGISEKDASKLFRETVLEVVKFKPDFINELRGEFFARYNEIIKNHMDVATDPDNKNSHKSAAVVNKAMQGLRSLTGADAPKEFAYRAQLDANINVQINLIPPTERRDDAESESESN